MKSTKMSAILVVALCLVGRVSADGELAYYKFDRDASDSSGNAWHGTVVGDASVYFGDERGGVLNLDGDGDYVTCTTGGTEDVFNLTGPMSVAVWIKVGGFDRDWQAIVTKGDTAWRLARDYNRNSLQFACTGVYFLHGDMNVNDGQWHHAAGVYDGSKISLYIDGVLDATAAALGDIASNTEVLRIGSNSERPGREWNGLIDDVRIYDSALSEVQISELAIPLVGFTYQGRLLNANEPADGLYDFEFKLRDAHTGGTVQGETIRLYDLDVIEGYFTATLHVQSNLLMGNALWLEVSVRPGDSNDTDDFVILGPRQKITPTPYALYAKHAGADSDWMVSENNMHSIVTGNVGIGTMSPSQKLEIDQGNILVRGLNGFNSDGEEGVLYLGNAPHHYMKAVYGFGLKMGTYGFPDAVSIRQYSGNVGIGTTGPEHKLHIKKPSPTEQFQLKIANPNGMYDSNGHAGIVFQVEDDKPGRGKGGILFESTGSWNRGNLHFLQNDAADGSQVSLADSVMMIQNDGRVGIGTSEPGQKLSVSGGMNIDQDNSNNGTIDYGLRFGTGWSGEGIASKRTSGGNLYGIDFYTGNVNRMCITNAGGVGIGTTSPSQLLHVAGNATLDGDIKVNESMVSYGTPISTEQSTKSTSWVKLSHFDIPDQGRDRLVTMNVLLRVKGENAGETAEFIVRGFCYGDGSTMDLADHYTSAPLLGAIHVRSTSYSDYYLNLGPFAVSNNQRWRFIVYYRTRNASYAAFITLMHWQARSIRYEY